LPFIFIRVYVFAYTPENVRESLNTSKGLPLAVDYVVKKEGPDKLLRTVQEHLNRRVFIVHGRDNEARETVTRFIEKLGLWAVILNEQPGASRAMIEKFERYANATFAVVLLTPDDVGSLRDHPDGLRPRARQNVVFELGYFMGRLGRGRVVALYKEGVELPSDFQGVEYLPFDANGAWKLSLAREIKNAGLDIDLNRAI
jgi:predicted nucleotide-binding protein